MVDDTSMCTIHNTQDEAFIKEDFSWYLLNTQYEFSYILSYLL